MGSKNTRHRDTGLTFTPPLPEGESRAVTTSNGEGGGGALEASRDRVTGRKASRAVPVPGPTVEQGAQGAMADQETLETMADLGTWKAMAEQGTRKAMADQETLETHGGSGDSGGHG